jgi:AAA+ superfamily predicted ATPase
MNTTINEKQAEHSTTSEFDYLEQLIQYRISNPSGDDLPAMPKVENWVLPVKKFLIEHGLDQDQDIATLLLIGLVPHVLPQLFDTAIQEKIKASGDFPEIGGVRGKNFRGFLPTGQTIVYLLAGTNFKRRKQVEQLFWPDNALAKKRILWLEELPLGEPVMSGKITMAMDYISLFLFDTAAPPHFSTSFPAKKITTKLSSKDIVMNEEIKRHYKNLQEWILHNPELTSEWDKQKRLKKGYRVLFYGPPGTGKTLTANVLGNETKKDVYKIDLSMVVSKYIGETEKNLEFLFARAEDKDWILFFDEADAIFGKRTGVRDAHDKYANQEVSYLLQRIEEFNGLVILATNMKNNIDDAFIRRFNDIVKFSIPSESERKEIWEKSFPFESDFGDIPNQVKRYDLSGGNINNVIHYAGIQAVKRNNDKIKKVVSMNGHQDVTYEQQSEPKKLKFYVEDVVEGIRREMIKEGKPFT